MGMNDLTVDEEVIGDGFWHVAAFTRMLLTEEEAGAVEVRMTRIAKDGQARYDGWQVTLTTREERQLSEFDHRGGRKSTE
jgi:hypothetical protein